MPLQTLTLHLDEITAGDYMSWVAHADPAALDHRLRSVALDAPPLGDTITAVLDWDGAVPGAHAAAAAAGLPITADVASATSRVQERRLAPVAYAA